MRTLLLLVVACAAFAQSQEPEFEATSIKPSGPIENGSFVGWKGGPEKDDRSRYTCAYCGVFMLIEDAYEIPYYRLTSAARLPDTRYHVIATIPEGTTKEQVHRMLQNLLANRFKLAVHRETREMQTFRLVVADGGLKVKPYVEGEARRAPDFREPGIYYKEQGRTMAEFAEFLAGYLAKPVIDGTGFKGKYDFDAWFTTDPNDTVAPSIFTAIRAEGLKVESQKEPVEMIVVDHVEKSPTAN